MTTTASPAKSDSKKPLHSLVAELDRQYRNTRKDWKKSSANFSSHEDRFRTAVPVSPLPYNPNNGTISDSIAHAKKSNSSWAKNSSPQRPPIPEIVCKGDYNPTESPSRSLTARSAFASQSPKFVETPAQAPPPGAYDPATPSPSKQRPSATMQSKSPRFSDPVIWTQTAYNPDVGTLNHEVQKSKKVASPWAKDKAAQRPSPTKLVDAVYEPKTPGQVPVVRSAFKSAAPRFLEEKAQAPPVGTYTSPLISCGMLS